MVTDGQDSQAGMGLAKFINGSELSLVITKLDTEAIIAGKFESPIRRKALPDYVVKGF